MQSTLGLTTKQAAENREMYGTNAIQEVEGHPIYDLLAKFSGLVPWMLEATFILQLSLGKKNEAIVTICLLVFNAVVGFIQENRAKSALALLKKKLQIKARVLRDGQWSFIDAQEIVPDDVISVRMGDFIPADIKIFSGNILVDRSALTGESMPIELKADENAFSGSIVRRGEAIGLVMATGKRSFFGKTAELVHFAKPESHLEKTIIQIVKYLVAMDLILVSIVFIYAALADIPLSEILPFSLVLLIASIPVALPATFTLMSAIASLELSEKGILVTRLAAIEEAAGMDVLCADKTGTLTQNCLALHDIIPLTPYTKQEVLKFAAFASNEASQDPFGTAIDSAGGKLSDLELKKRTKFIPFDSLTKRSEALVNDQNKTLRVIMGSPSGIASMADNSNSVDIANRLGNQGARMLAIAIGDHERMHLIGFLAFTDPLRIDSRKTLEELQQLGVSTKMITGDIMPTAKAIAEEAGIGSKICTRELIVSKEIKDCDLFAEVFPEDKYKIVKALQEQGCIVGMTGDGVNDAPALRQADMGVAISNATDVAKAAASIILVNPGLSDLPTAINTGREVYRRMLTYTLNKIVKTTQIALFLSLSFLLENVFVATPRLVMFLLFANDFVTMSLANDNARISRGPCRFRIRFLTATSLLLAVCWLIFSFGIFYAARDVLVLPLPAIQTLIFLMFVYSGLATVYLVRTRDFFWRLRPGKLLWISTVGDILAVSALAYFGIGMERLAPSYILLLAASVAAYMALLDVIKVFGTRRYSAARIIS